jgi:hypothetical protein
MEYYDVGNNSPRATLAAAVSRFTSIGNASMPPIVRSSFSSSNTGSIYCINQVKTDFTIITVFDFFKKKQISFENDV